MSWEKTFIWGFAATTVLTIILTGSRGLNVTRMDLTFLLGTMFTPDRDKARRLGFYFHMINGWGFAFIYAAAFAASGTSTVAFGMLIGLVHSLFVLVAGLEIVASAHPRMATEQHGPDPTHLLEPPGFMARHYGNQTAIITIVAHVAYGAVLGYFL